MIIIMINIHILAVIMTKITINISNIAIDENCYNYSNWEYYDYEMNYTYYHGYTYIGPIHVVKTMIII